MREIHSHRPAIPAARRGAPALRRAAVAGALMLAAPAAADPAERAAFIGRHACTLAARLAAIHRAGPVATSRDRFLTVALRGRPQHYVQCIFHDRDAAMFCEASSGAYRYTADAEVRLRQSAESVAALRALGFALPDPRENFSREVALGDPPDVRVAAALMLAALHDAYGARPGDELDVTAPRARGPVTGCGTPAR